MSSDQSFQLCSTNPFYKPYEVHVNDVIEIWKFVNYISPELPEIRLDDNELSQSIKSLQKEVHDLRGLIKS